MTAKEKANEILESFRDGILALTLFNDKEVLVKFAIIHVKGIIEQLESIGFRTSIGGVISYEGGQLIDKIQYWRDVLTELNQM